MRSIGEDPSVKTALDTLFSPDYKEAVVEKVDMMTAAARAAVLAASLDADEPVEEDEARPIVHHPPTRRNNLRSRSSIGGAIF